MSPRPKIYIATPSHDHKFHAGFAFSLIKLINARLYPLVPSKVGGAGVARARNNMAAEFLKTDCDFFVCIDADISFLPEHVAALVECNLPIVCGLYAIKQHALRWCVTALADEKPDPVSGLQKVLEAGTGFMCIRRDVFERMITAHPEIAYREDLDEARGVTRWDFFSMGVVDGRYLSEDYFFCRRARALGFDVHMHTRFHVQHEGMISFPLSNVFASAEQSMSAEPLWPAEFLAAGIAPDHCADVLAGAYDIPELKLAAPVVLDLGANIGAFARWAVGRWPTATIHCYEPHPGNFSLLEKTIEGLPENPAIRVTQAAILDHAGDMSLRLGAHNCGEHSLFDIGEQTAHSVVVPVLPASGLPLADVIKLDTEGSELPILRDLARCGRLSAVTAVLLEYHSDSDAENITTLLDEEGFRCIARRVRCANRGELKFLRPAPPASA